MKKNSLLRRTVCLTGSAILLAGLLTGFSLKTPGALAVSAKADYVPVNNESLYRVDVDGLNVRTGPGITYEIVRGLPEDSTVELLELNGKWGRISEGWVDTSFLRPEGRNYYNNGGVTGYVTASALNVRTGPGGNYAICGQVMEGYKLTILETQNGWGRTSDGWVSLQYVNRVGAPAVNPSPGYNGVRVNANLLNVRQGPGTNYAKVGTLTNGTPVNVLEIRGDWGRISSGWICLNYVTGIKGFQNTVYGETVEVTADTLNVRQGPGMNFQATGMMTRGYRAVVQEARNGWGKVDNGWICLDYVRFIR